MRTTIKYEFDNEDQIDRIYRVVHAEDIVAALFSFREWLHKDENEDKTVDDVLKELYSIIDYYGLTSLI